MNTVKSIRNVSPRLASFVGRIKSIGRDTVDLERDGELHRCNATKPLVDKGVELQGSPVYATIVVHATFNRLVLLVPVTDESPNLSLERSWERMRQEWGELFRRLE